MESLVAAMDELEVVTGYRVLVGGRVVLDKGFREGAKRVSHESGDVVVEANYSKWPGLVKYVLRRLEERGVLASIAEAYGGVGSRERVVRDGEEVVDRLVSLIGVRDLARLLERAGVDVEDLEDPGAMERFRRQVEKMLGKRIARRVFGE